MAGRTNGVNERELEAAIEATELASRVCRHVGRQITAGWSGKVVKADQSPVTVADFAAQAVVMRTLGERLGTVAMAAEESSAHLRSGAGAGVLAAVVAALRESGVWADAAGDAVLEAIDLGAREAAGRVGNEGRPASGPFWTLDPIDGTKGFLRGQQYAVCLARIDGERATLGVLGCPHLSEDFTKSFEEADGVGGLFWALAGEGAWTRPLGWPAATARRMLREAWHDSHAPRITYSVDPGHARREHFEALMEALAPAGPPAQLDSQCKYAVVARAQADVYYRPPRRSGAENIWDHAAGCLLVEEAGCVVSDVAGRALEFGRLKMDRNRGIVAAPPGLHERVLEAVNRIERRG